jgi:hypothetical protein
MTENHDLTLSRMRFLILSLLCLFLFATFGLAIEPPAPQSGELNNDAAVAALVTFLAGAGLWFVVLGAGAERER